MTQFDLLKEAPLQEVTWEPSREAGLHRLTMFVPEAGRAYASRRNYDLGPEDRSNISCLSPWLRHRLLLEEEVVRQTLHRHALSTAEKFIQEVFWRAYFKGWLQHRPDVWLRYRADVRRLAKGLDDDCHWKERYQTALAGRTGIDCFDHWVKELVETGYLHNHARMWFASLWIFTLELPWQMGADFFLRHLLDGDPASNTLSWRWVGGLHTKGKHYLARRSNIEKYTDGRFSPKGLNENAGPLQEEGEDALQQPPYGKIETIGEKPFGLLITEEDCNAHTLPLGQAPLGVCGVSATAERSPLPVSDLVKDFAQGAVGEATQQASAHFACPVDDGETLAAADWGERLLHFAENIGVSTLVTAHAPVGPVKERIDRAKRFLQEHNIHLVEVHRPYDLAAWPHATRGFFKLKKKIPSLIDNLQLSERR